MILLQFARIQRLDRDILRQGCFIGKRLHLRHHKHLNNVAGRDHRVSKRLSHPVLGFKQFRAARRTMRGLEVIDAVRMDRARHVVNRDELQVNNH